MSALTAGGPVLVHFIDFSQINSVRTLPYLAEWDRRYREVGLKTIAVQTHRFPFGADPAVVAVGLGRLGVKFPVALDAERLLWHAYGCNGWPSLFLWSLGGALAWYHFGEGEYLGTEEAIQAELRGIDALRELPAPWAALRDSDQPGVRVLTPTPEILPGGSWERPWIAGEDGEELVIEYESGGAYATVEGKGAITIEIDGASRRRIEVDTPALYPLLEHRCHQHHAIILRPTTGMRIWSIGFAAGLPDR